MRTPFALASGLLAAALWATAAAVAEPPRGAPRMEQLNPSLSEALTAIKQRPLEGAFLFIPAADSSAAMAAYLLRDHATLKRFVRKAEKDIKRVRAITRWDKMVCLHLVAMGVDNAGPDGGPRLSPKWVARVQELTLAQSVAYQDMLIKRGGGN
ncbi:MAG: hypothetical protein ABIJ96_07005 [Elusimicrobiota bacterium]